MSRYRATDEQIDREIEALERIARVRVRRAALEMRDLDRDLRELRRERARRKAHAEVDATASADSTAEEA